MRQHPLEPVALVLDESDGAGQGRGLTPGEPLENLLRHHARLMRQIRSSARSSGTVRTGPGRTATRSTRVAVAARMSRSEEHTSELQSRLHLVCRLLLEK